MLRSKWFHIALVVILALIVLFIIRMHVAAAQVAPLGSKGNAESGRLSAQAWCTECHSVEPETAGTGKFAPDFTVIAQRQIRPLAKRIPAVEAHADAGLRAQSPRGRRHRRLFPQPEAQLNATQGLQPSRAAPNDKTPQMTMRATGDVCFPLTMKLSGFDRSSDIG